VNRRLFVASSIGAALAGCSSATNALNENASVKGVIDSAEGLNRFVIGTHGMAKVYPDSAIDRDFRTNGLATPTSDPNYARVVRSGFADYRLPITGLVDHPQTLSIRALQALSSLSQATRHDCVEGWSIVGKWTGVPLAKILAMVAPKPEARYVVFYSYDRDDQGTPFYGSLGIHQAAHPQTQLALKLNDKPIDTDHGGPVRLRIPTQLAYKSTKWVQRIELVSSFKSIYGGKGGYWEDNGYEWYAGI